MKVTRKPKLLMVALAVAAASTLAGSVVAAREATVSAALELIRLERTVGTPRYPAHIADSDGSTVKAKPGFRLVVIPLTVVTASGKLTIGDLDFSCVTDDGRRYGAVAVALDGTFAVPEDGYNTRLSHECDANERVTVESAFCVPEDARRVQLRCAAPIGTVAL